MKFLTRNIVGQTRKTLWIFTVILILCSSTALAACANSDTPATIVVHQKNEEIPSLVAQGEADVMITEITEAPYYVQADSRLAAQLLNEPFTHGEMGYHMTKMKV